MELNTVVILWFTLALLAALHTLWAFAAAAAGDKLPGFLSRDPTVAALFVWGGVLLAAAIHALYLLIQL